MKNWKLCFISVMNSFLPQIAIASDIKDPQFDGVVVVTDSEDHIPAALQSSRSVISEYLKVWITLCNIFQYF